MKAETGSTDAFWSDVFIKIDVITLLLFLATVIIKLLGLTNPDASILNDVTPQATYKEMGATAFWYVPRAVFIGGGAVVGERKKKGVRMTVVVVRITVWRGWCPSCGD